MNKRKRDRERLRDHFFYKKCVYIWPLESRTIQSQKKLFEMYLFTYVIEKKRIEKKCDKMLRFEWIFNESLHSVFFLSLVFLLSHSRIAIFVLLIFSFCFEFCNNSGVCVRTAFVFFKFKLYFGRGSSCEPFRLFQQRKHKKKRKKNTSCLHKESTIGNCDNGLRKHFFIYYFSSPFSQSEGIGFFSMYSGAKS